MAILNKLKEQLLHNNKDIRNGAEQCLLIAEKLMELEDGHIWSSQWRVLVKVGWFEGKGLDAKCYYKPTEIGKVFLKGINS